MSTSVEDFIDGLLSKEALELPSDTVKSKELSLELPTWFDEKKFNNGRRFFWDYSYSFFVSIMLGLLGSLAIPSVLRVLISTRRSTTPYTAYKRHASTALHIVSWFESELKPGSVSWRSLLEVRRRHIRAGLAGKLKGFGIVSQRDLALGQFGIICYAVLKPDKFGIRQLNKSDWDAYIHFWRVIGYMLGLEDRYNVCRDSFYETQQVCQVLQEKVFHPCLVNPPEYFEHMARVFLEGMKTVIPGVDVHSMLYFFKNLSDVPGYIYTEAERIKLQKRLRIKLIGKLPFAGVEASTLAQKPFDDVPTTHRILYYSDYETFKTVPVYNQLPMPSKIRLNVNAMLLSLNSIYIVRVFFNLIFKFTVFTIRHFPYGAFAKFGFKASFINPFVEGPVDNVKLKFNDEYYQEDRVR